MRARRKIGVGAALAAAMVAGVVHASPAGATPLAPFIDLEEVGLALVEDGVGLSDLGAGTETVTVDIGGPVRFALLYWAGRDRDCPMAGGTCTIPSEPYGDQELTFEGTPLTGVIIGTEATPTTKINNIGYFADVTSIVTAAGTGPQTFTISDTDPGNDLDDLNGAGLLVGYTDPADPQRWRVIVHDGLDYAFGKDRDSGAPRTTTPVTFGYASAPTSRTAEAFVFVGDTVASRPDRIRISGNPTLVNRLDGSDGETWDTDAFPVQLAAGATSTTVQVISPSSASNPDSLLWSMAALRLPVPSDDPPPPPPPGDEGCTPGYWKNHPEDWPGTGYTTGQTAQSVFAGASGYPSLAGKSLLATLGGGGGDGTTGGAKILLRAATAAVLNAGSPDVAYTRTTADIIDDVDAALASGDRATMLDLAAELDADNNGGCPL